MVEQRASASGQSRPPTHSQGRWVVRRARPLLAAYAALLAVTTAITGFYGQNVPYPGSQKTSGFITSVLLLAGAVIGLFVFFKKKHYL